MILGSVLISSLFEESLDGISAYTFSRRVDLGPNCL